MLLKIKDKSDFSDLFFLQVAPKFKIRILICVLVFPTYLLLLLRNILHLRGMSEEHLLFLFSALINDSNALPLYTLKEYNLMHVLEFTPWIKVSQSLNAGLRVKLCQTYSPDFALTQDELTAWAKALNTVLTKLGDSQNETIREIHQVS